MLHATTADGVDVAVHDLGGDGPPLLLAHATGFCGLAWRPFAAALSERHRCLALDFRGHGCTDPNPGHDFHWSGFSADVLAVVDDLGLEGAVAVGHSKGAAALLLAEAQRPGTFSRLWLFEPIVFPVDPPAPSDEVPLVAGALRRRAEFPSRDEAAANFASKPPLDVLHPDALAGYVECGFRSLDDGRVTLSCPPEVEAQVYRMGPAHDMWWRLPDLATPATIACGAHTDAIVPDFAAAMAARLPHGRHEVFGDLGHFGPLEDPAATAAAAAEFLDG